MQNFFYFPFFFLDVHIFLWDFFSAFLFNLLEQHVQGAGGLTEVADGDARALEALLDCTSAVASDETSPFGELGALWNLDEVDVVLCAECLDELLVLCFFAIFSEDAQMRSAAVERACDLRDTTDQAVDLDGLADDDRECLLDVLWFRVDWCRCDGCCVLDRWGRSVSFGRH